MLASFVLIFILFSKESVHIVCLHAMCMGDPGALKPTELFQCISANAYHFIKILKTDPGNSSTAETIAVLNIFFIRH